MSAEDAVLSDYETSQILLLCSISESKGAPVPISEITLLVPRLTKERLLKAWNAKNELSSKYSIVNDFIVPHTGKKEITFAEDYKQSISNLSVARQFLRLCGHSWLECLCVSGSTSYFSARKEDDIDLFCITKSGYTWIFLTKALILARLFRWINKNASELTISLVMDRIYALIDFSTPKDPLYARDALTTVEIFGSSFYRNLLMRSKWMEDIYPLLYKRKVSEHSPTAEPRTRISDQRSAGKAVTLLNVFLYFVIGRYILLRAWLANRRLSKLRKRGAIFRVRIGPRYLVYESAQYLALKRVYYQLGRLIKLDRGISLAEG
jgi:hypothetical protein